MKKSEKIVSITAMFLLIIAILISSFQIVMYGDPEYKFYKKLYEKYTVVDDLNMDLDDVMEVTDHMMAYLIGDEEVLSIVTDVDGEVQDFFNEQDRIHMKDVQNLMFGGLKVRTVCLVSAAVLLLYLIIKKSDLKKLLPAAYVKALGIFLGIVVFLGIAFAIDFTSCFVIFHEIFFTNDLWLFDYNTDYMIRMLPEGFFADMTVRILVTFVGILLGIMVLIGFWKYYDKKKNKDL